MDFKYGDKVRITQGFYEGFEGGLTGSRRIARTTQYCVEAIKQVPGRNMYVNEWFNGNMLEKIG